MEDNTKTKIKKLLLSEVNPLLEQRVAKKAQYEKVEAMKVALAEEKEILEKMEAKEASDFQSVLELCDMAQLGITTATTNNQLLDMLMVKRTEDTNELAVRMVRDIANGIDSRHSSER